MIFLIILIFSIGFIFTIMNAGITTNIKNLNTMLYEPSKYSIFLLFGITISSYIFAYFVPNFLYIFLFMCSELLVYMYIIDVIYTKKVKKQKTMIHSNDYKDVKIKDMWIK